MRIMTNKEKLEALKQWLTENKVKFEENHYSKTKSITFDLLIAAHRIVVHLSDEKDQAFYKKVRKYYKPFFIREGETVEFIIEKMQNCIADQMVQAQKQFENEQKRAEGMREAEENMKRHEEKEAAKLAAQKPKRQRVRIQRFEKVEPRRKEV